MNEPGKINIKLNLLILISLVCIFHIVLTPSLWSDGMFLDGVTYAAVSKNLANGIGSFWNPHYTDFLYPEFHEHPPLALFMESLFFRFLGESIYTERAYSFFTFLVVCVIIALIWKQLGYNISTSWIPLLFYFITPLTIWVFSNNMLDNTLSIFLGLSVLFYLKSLDKNKVVFLFLCGLMIFFGLLTKGPFALFPLSLPFIAWLVKKEKLIWQAISDTTIIGVTVILVTLFLFLNAEAADGLTKYYNRQILGGLSTVTVDNRFYIMERFLVEIVPSVLIIILLFIFSKIKFSKLRREDLISKESGLFILLGLSGVIPIMISLKQRGYYLAPSLPFFSIGFSLLAYDKIISLIQRIKINPKGFRLFQATVFVILIFSLVFPFSRINKFNRNKDLIADINSILTVVPKNSSINIAPELFEDWGLHAYFARYANISLDNNIKNRKSFLLIKTDKFDQSLLSKCEKVDIPLKTFYLYRRIQ